MRRKNLQNKRKSRKRTVEGKNHEVFDKAAQGSEQSAGAKTTVFEITFDGSPRKTHSFSGTRH